MVSDPSATGDVLSLTKGLRPGEAALCRECAERTPWVDVSKEAPYEMSHRYFCAFLDRALCDPGLRVEAGVERCDWFTRKEKRNG